MKIFKMQRQVLLYSTLSVVLVGLVFVGLGFRNNTRSIKAERIDSYVQGTAEITMSLLENETLTDIIYQAYADPESLSGADLDSAQHWMMLSYMNFMRVHRAHQSGLIPEDLYELERRGVGFAFSSDVGRGVIEIFRASDLASEVWDIIDQSSKQAQAYCLNSENRCVSRYSAGLRNSN